MARKPRQPTPPVQSQEDELRELVDAADEEHGRRSFLIQQEHIDDLDNPIVAQKIHQAMKDITREFSEQYPIFAAAYGPKKPKTNKSVQFKKVQGNVWIDKDAEKYD